jgi:hypothetical protein
MTQTQYKGIGGHQSANMKTDEWLTPPEIIKALGPFDLDPCSPVNRPWDTAKVHYTIQDNGLTKEWFGRVWLNPPYGREIELWMKLMAGHGQGTGLIFARTETRFFQQYVFGSADSILFLDGRLYFHNVAGIRAKANAGAPSVLIAYGRYDVERLGDSGLKGKHVLINAVPVIVVGISPSWKSVVSIALSRLNGTGSLNEIYDLVEQIAPDKVANNVSYREKIRQQLQYHFTRISKGKYTA